MSYKITPQLYPILDIVLLQVGSGIRNVKYVLLNSNGIIL